MASVVSTLTRAATQKRVWIPAAAIGIALLSFATGLIAAAFVRNGIGNEQFWKIAAQPTATVGAGVLAIGAATIALTGVLLTQRTNVRTAKAQLRNQRAALIRQEKQHSKQLAQQIEAMNAQQRQHEAQLAAAAELEAAKHKRQAVLDAKLAAAASLTALTNASTAVDQAIQRRNADPIPSSLANPLGGPPPANDPVQAAIRACNDARDACTTTSIALLIVGEIKAYHAVQTFANAVGRWLVDTASKGQEINAMQVTLHGVTRLAAVAALADLTAEQVANAK